MIERAAEIARLPGRKVNVFVEVEHSSVVISRLDDVKEDRRDDGDDSKNRRYLIRCRPLPIPISVSCRGGSDNE